MKNKKTLAAILGSATAAAALYGLTPSYEGTVYKTYKDMGGVLTYCTGATEDAQWGKTYTKEECIAQLDYDLARHAEGMLACTKAPLTEGQKIAFTDFTFNVGVSAYCSSTVARKANAGDVKGSCDALLMWNKVNGKPVNGLTRRREEERKICLT
jgi:lysozyme